MGKCVDCGGHADTMYGRYDNAYLCSECANKRNQEKILEKSQTLTSCEDFKTWDSGDMSELFWIHLGRYVKNPNAESLEMMRMAYSWACHSSHGIANSFRHALQWAKVDIWAEECDKDGI